VTPASYLNEACTSVLHENLTLSCLWTIRVYPMFHFQLFFTCCTLLLLSKLFVTKFLNFFDLDRHHPVWLQKLPMSATYISSIPLSWNVLVYAHASVGVFTRTPFSPISRWIQHFSANGWSISGDGSTGRVLPRLKGRTQYVHLYSSFWIVWLR
jgi:hypothetical protein